MTSTGWRRFRVLTSCLLLLGLSLPVRADMAHAGRVATTYLADSADCEATLTNAGALPPPRAAFPHGVSGLCLVVLGLFQKGDRVAARITDATGRVVWQGGQWNGYQTVRDPARFGAHGLEALFFRAVRYRPPSGGLWPVGRYRAEATLNGAVVAASIWTVGQTPRVPAGTATPARRVNTPIPPSATPPPPPASPTAVAAPSTVLFQGTNFTIMLPRTWTVDHLPSGQPVFYSPGRSIELLAQASPSTATLTENDATTAINFNAEQANAILQQHLVPQIGPYAIGALQGYAGVAHIGNTQAGFTIAALSDGQFEALVVEIVFPTADTQAIAEAGAAVASFRVPA